MEPNQVPLTTDATATGTSTHEMQAALLMRLMPPSAMRAFATAIGGTATLIDRDLRIVYSFNPAVDPTGERATQLTGRPVTDLSTPDSERRGTNAIRQTLVTGDVLTFETKVQAADGTFIIAEGRSTPVYDGDVIVGTLVQSRDVTAEKEARKILRQTQQLYGLMTSNLPGVALAVYGLDGAIRLSLACLLVKWA